MSMQADIKWIQTELELLQDQSLIDTLKQMIEYGKSQKQNEGVSEAYYQKLEEELDETPSHKWDDVKKELIDTYNL